VARIDEFRATLADSVATALLFTIPSSVGLAVLGESMIALIYQGGRFHASDTRQTATALACYSVGLAGYSLTKILGPAFYALDDARTPMFVSIGSVVVNLAASYALIYWARMGHAGLALSIGLVALCGAAALFELLRRRIGGLQTPRIASSAARIVAASAVMGAVCFGAQRFLALRHAANLAVGIPLGIGVFYASARLLRVPELEAIRTACYTFLRDAPRPEVSHPPTGN
jgi:putative peptidoglycan lipid II flippase